MDREELEARYNDAMKRADGWGQFSNDHNDSRGALVNGKDYKQRIQDAQKEAQWAIKELNKINSLKK